MGPASRPSLLHWAPAIWPTLLAQPAGCTLAGTALARLAAPAGPAPQLYPLDPTPLNPGLDPGLSLVRYVDRDAAAASWATNCTQRQALLSSLLAGMAGSGSSGSSGSSGLRRWVPLANGLAALQTLAWTAQVAGSGSYCGSGSGNDVLDWLTSNSTWGAATRTLGPDSALLLLDGLAGVAVNTQARLDGLKAFGAAQGLPGSGSSSGGAATWQRALSRGYSNVQWAASSAVALCASPLLASSSP